MQAIFSAKNVFCCTFRGDAKPTGPTLSYGRMVNGSDVASISSSPAIFMGKDSAFFAVYVDRYARVRARVRRRGARWQRKRVPQLAAVLSGREEGQCQLQRVFHPPQRRTRRGAISSEWTTERV